MSKCMHMRGKRVDNDRLTRTSFEKEEGKNDKVVSSLDHSIITYDPYINQSRLERSKAGIDGTKRNNFSTHSKHYYAVQILRTYIRPHNSIVAVYDNTNHLRREGEGEG